MYTLKFNCIDVIDKVDKRFLVNNVNLYLSDKKCCNSFTN